MGRATKVLALGWAVLAISTPAQAQAPSDQRAFDGEYAGRTFRGTIASTSYTWRVLPGGYLEAKAAGETGYSSYTYRRVTTRIGELVMTDYETGDRCTNRVTFNSRTSGTVFAGCLGVTGSWSIPPLASARNAPTDQSDWTSRFQGGTFSARWNTGEASEFRFVDAHRFRQSGDGDTASGVFHYARSGSSTGFFVLEYDDGRICLSEVGFTTETRGRFTNICGYDGRALESGTGTWTWAEDQEPEPPPPGPDDDDGGDDDGMSVSDLLDINEDGNFDQEDILIAYYAYTVSDLLGDGDSGGIARFRQVLLSALTGSLPNNDVGYRELLRRANALKTATCPAVP